MRIDKIELVWFRGAAAKAVLKANSSSVVVYGDTASGKSSFVDAVEYIISNGKIEHLRHEYSDTYLRNCVRNTKSSDDSISIACMHFENGNYVKVEVPKAGKIRFESNPADLIDTIQKWDVKRHILRQDEIANFIQETKSQKYSALSPLLGLQVYEDVAENIIKIKTNVVQESGYEDLKGQFKVIEAEINQFFTSIHEPDVKETIQERARKYVQFSESETVESISKKAISELDKISKSIEPEIKRYLTLENIHKAKIQEKIRAMISSDEALARIGEEHVDSKIAILENTNKILESLPVLATNVECPACGREILGTEFKDHVTHELDALREARKVREQAIKNRRELAIALSNINVQIKSEKAVADWLTLPEKVGVKELVDKLENVIVEDSAARWSSDSVESLKAVISPLLLIIEKELEVKPPTTDEILADYSFFRTALKILEIKKLNDKITKIEVLISALQKIHDKIRERISKMTVQVLTEISDEIRRIWVKIHPGQPIDDIRLVPSPEKDKAVDICLRFYGTKQSSPRLTLSEGYRNSLGLSIFLALANQGETREHPIFLDDIVSSLDREHRGMIIDVLREELSGRQVFLFTHDREWFGELRNRLEPDHWVFYTLQKWFSPETGIQLIPSDYTFEEAEALLPAHVKPSGNAVRAIMDTELPRAAEKLNLFMPYKQGIRNDYRTCIDFLEVFISEGKRKFKIRKNSNWQVYQEAIDAWQKAKELVVAWANRASHTGSLSVSEARKLISVCRDALSYFECPDCKKKIWALSHSDYVRCECGRVRWKIKE